jgi:hypothetical protein
MRLNIHSPWHWVAIAAVAAVALFAFGEAHGQSTGAGAAFEGRPAMSGAQAGEGPMAGPPQGGVAPQSRDDPRSGVELWKPRREGDRDVRPSDPGGVGAPGGGGEVRPQRDRDSGDVIRKPRDTSGLQDQGDTGRVMKRATKRTFERARRGVSGIDG